MKKFFSFLLITFLLACSFRYTPSFANPVPLPNWSDPGITEIINLSDLTGWMQNGGVFDVSNFDNAEEFLNWYFKIRVPYVDENGQIGTAPAFGNDTFNLSPGNMSYADITNPRGIISNSFREHTGYGRTFQSDFENYSLTGGNLIDMPFQLLDRRSIGNFNLYKYDSLTNYIQNFEYESEPGNLPAEFSWMQFVNTHKIGYPAAADGSYPAAYYNLDLLNFVVNGNVVSKPESYCIIVPNNSNDVLNIYKTTGNWLYPSICTAGNIYITTDNADGSGAASYTMDGISLLYQIDGAAQYYSMYPALDSDNVTPVWAFYSATQGYFPSLSSNFQNLSACLFYIDQHFRGVNLYVNGEKWLDIRDGHRITPEFPNVVGGEELPVTTWPLHVPKAPAYINGTGIINAIQRAINTDGTFDFGDLQDEITDSDGNPFPINDWVEIPFGDTIPNPDPDDDSVTGTPTPPIPDPDIIPIIPDPIHNAFQGTTILAELVDATQTALPSDLITVFWGIVFILFILGIIKILHK